MWLKTMGVNRNRREKSCKRHDLAQPALVLLDGFGPTELVRRHHFRIEHQRKAGHHRLRESPTRTPRLFARPDCGSPVGPNRRAPQRGGYDDSCLMENPTDAGDGCIMAEGSNIPLLRRTWSPG